MRAVASIVGLWLVLALELGAAPQLSLGTNAAAPGASVTLTNQFTTDTTVVALQYDVLFDGGKLASTGIAGGNALLDHAVFVNALGNGTNRVLVYSLNNAALSNGVLAQLYFSIASNAPLGTTAITFTNGLLANAAGLAVNGASYVPGSLTITSGAARLGSITRGTGGLIQFQVVGSANASYVIEASTNLVNWIPIHTNAAVNGLIQLQDADSAVFSLRFYRAFSVP